MNQINPHLFVYGTLLSSQNSYGAYLQQHCIFLQPGKFKGKLYDMGEYPGAVVQETGDQYVYGSIYLMDEPKRYWLLLMITKALVTTRNIQIYLSEY